MKYIREQRKDPLLRILLRTGQPGIAPERQTIEQYDIDDYLPKSQLSSARLYTSVRTALRAYLQRSQLQRQRESLAILHQLAATLHTVGGLSATLERILQIASALVPNSLALLEMNSPLTDPPLDLFFYLAANPEDADLRARLLAEEIRLRYGQEQPLGSKGLFVPLGLDEALGRGWMFFEGKFDEPFDHQLLALLASHASNVFYVAIGQAFLAAREQPESQRLRL